MGIGNFATRPRCVSLPDGILQRFLFLEGMHIVSAIREKVTLITQFGGDGTRDPTVQILPRVDVEAVTAGDDDYQRMKK